MPKLTLENYTYYKEIVQADEKAHASMLDKAVPEKVMDAYEGRICELQGNETTVKGNNIEDYIFIAANTVIPTLFYQMPRPIIRGKRQELSYSAAVIDALVRAYTTDNFKKEIQTCIIDAYLPYPFAVCKVGYNSRTGKYQAPNLITGQTQGGGDDKSMEASQEYLKFEKPFIERVSPRDAFLDSSKAFGKGQRITFQYTRTLQELIDSNLYSLPSDFVDYFKVRSGDNRKVKLSIKEHWCLIGGYAWKLVYTPDWHEELAWDKTPYKELPCELLRFNDLGDRLYTTSHGYLAYEAQQELSYYNDLWKEHIDKIRRQHIVDESGLTEQGKKALHSNQIDAVISANRPVGTIYQQIVSQPMGKDVYAGIDNVRNYLKLLLSASGGKGGETDVEFAYTEKQQAVGDMMRTSGLQDTIRDFARGLIRKTVSNLVRFGDPEITVQITGKNVIDPITGEVITGKEIQFGGENGLKIQEEIKGNVDTDYVYDVDISSAQRPDFPVVRQQLKEFAELMIMLEPKLNALGKKFDYAEFAKDYANTFETLVDPQKYIDDLTPEEKQLAMMSAQMNGQMAGASMGKGGPTPGVPAVNPANPMGGPQ